MSNYRETEAKRIGLFAALRTAENASVQAKAREVRAENVRRTERDAWIRADNAEGHDPRSLYVSEADDPFAQNRE